MPSPSSPGLRVIARRLGNSGPKRDVEDHGARVLEPRSAAATNAWTASTNASGCSTCRLRLVLGRFSSDRQHCGFPHGNSMVRHLSAARRRARARRSLACDARWLLIGQRRVAGTGHREVLRSHPGTEIMAVGYAVENGHHVSPHAEAAIALEVGLPLPPAEDLHALPAPGLTAVLAGEVDEESCPGLARAVVAHRPRDLRPVRVVDDQ